MAVNTVFSPFPLFTDADGHPLEAGYVYIGAEGLNPETNPVAVFWDEEKTQPAAQPVRTINGYPSRDGTPSALYTGGAYGITVRNRRGELVFSDLSAGYRIILSIDRFFDDVADMQANAAATYPAGTILNTRAESYAFEVVATGEDRTLDAGAKVKALPLDGAFHTAQFAGADIGAQFNAAVAAVKRERTGSSATTWGPDAYSIRVTPGVYAQTTMMEMIDCANFNVDFTGAEITNFAGSITNFKMINSPRTTITGLFINLRNNNNPDQAIWLAGQNSWVTFVDCGVMANTSNTDFACVRVQQGSTAGIDNDDRDKGNFWLTLDRFWCRKLTGADSNDIPIGVDLQGAVNAFRCINGSIATVGTGILIQNQNGSTASGITNDAQIMATAFEGFTSAVKFTTTDSGDGIAGGTITNCRFESGTNVLEMSGFNANPSTPIFLSGNTVISSVTNYVTTGNTNWYNSMDAFWTPNLARPRIRTPQGMRISSIGTATSLSVGSVTASNGGALAIERDNGTVDGKLSQRSGGGLEIDGGAPGIVAFNAARHLIFNLPTSAGGLPVGTIYRDGTTLKVVV